MNIGERVGDYEIVEVLGIGGMGQVYKVRNILSERIEAMKVLLPNLESDPGLADRFLREIKVQAALDHPNIASFHTAMRNGNQLLMFMEFVDGISLAKRMEGGPVPAAESAAIGAQVLDALSYAHGHGVIHRDIKPANIMITGAGVVKLMDFGIARMQADTRLTQTGSAVGSLSYMSPEQIRGSEPDPRSDLYSLGITLYEMVTGRRPFAGESDYQIMFAHMQQVPASPIEIVPSVPADLSEIIVTSIAKDPTARFQSAAAFHAALLNVFPEIATSGRGIVTGTKLPVSAAPPPLPPSAPPASVAPPPLPSPAAAPPVAPPQVLAAQPPTIPKMPAAPAPPPPVAMKSQPPSAPPPISRPAPQPAPPVVMQPQVAMQQPTPTYTAPPPQAYSMPVQAMQAQRSNLRGVYMAVGSIATVAVLIVAMLEGPKLFHGRTSAAEGTNSSETSSAGSKGSSDGKASNASSSDPAQPGTASQSSAPSQSGGPGWTPVGQSATASPGGTSSPAQVREGQGATPAPQSFAPLAAPQAPQGQSQGAPGSQAQQQAPRQQFAPLPAPPAQQGGAPQQGGGQQQGAPQQFAPLPTPGNPAPANPELAAVRTQLNQVTIRANSAGAGLQSFQDQQSRQGLGLRGDIREAKTRLDFQLGEASTALQNGDIEGAKQAIKYAQSAVDTIQKFLGR